MKREGAEMRFRKKPVVIDAIRFTGENCLEILAFMGRPDLAANLEIHNTDRPCIHTLEGTMTASPGDWIIKGAQGEFYPCKPEVFDSVYEPAQ